MEGFDTWFPEVVVIQLEDFDHTFCLIIVIDKAFTILLRRDDVLLVPLICWKAENLAFSPCVWYLGETF